MWDYHGNPVACPHQKSKKMCGQMVGIRFFLVGKWRAKPSKVVGIRWANEKNRAITKILGSA